MNIQFGNQELEGNDKLAYNFSQQSYKKANERTNVGDYEYDSSCPMWTLLYGTTRKTRRRT